MQSLMVFEVVTVFFWMMPSSFLSAPPRVFFTIAPVDVTETCDFMITLDSTDNFAMNFSNSVPANCLAP